ncbi:MAG: hypothetical protein U0169_06950 [Polyangiaceae bacterium]
MNSSFFRLAFVASLSLASVTGVVGCSDSTSDGGVDPDTRKAVSSLDIDGDRTIDIGDTEQRTATVKYADGTSKDVTKDTVLV